MATLQELIAQKAELDRQIAALQSSSRADAVQKVRALMNEYGLSAADVMGSPRAGSAAVGKDSANKVAPKYKDIVSGKTWTGRGMKPVWVRNALADGKAMSDLAI